MSKVYVSDEIDMVLKSMENIHKEHVLYDTYYEKEVENDFHVHVSGNAIVYDNAIVFGNATVFGNARVSGNARVYDNAAVFGNAIVYENAAVSGNAIVYENARVFENARVYDNAIVYENAAVFGNAIVYENAAATKKVLNFDYFPYNITLTDKHIQIGCKQFTYEKALKLAERNIDIDNGDYNTMIVYKDLILELIKLKLGS